jgi:transposase-like protein
MVNILRLVAVGANIIPFFEYPDVIRVSVYTTNAIESLNSVIRRAVEARKIYPQR